MIKLHSEINGQGKILILLHGNNEDSTYFNHQIEYFKHHYRVIALDTRGHGKSPRGSKPFTIRQFVEDLANYVKENEIERFHLLGFSDGGNIALLFAATYPQYIDKLIVDGANLNTQGVKLKFQIPTTIQYYRYKFFSRINKTFITKYEMVRLMVKDPMISDEDLGKIKSRTLVLAGNEDDIKESHTKYIASSIKNSQLVIISGDHFIAKNNPEIFNQVVDKFLKE